MTDYRLDLPTRKGRQSGQQTDESEYVEKQKLTKCVNWEGR